MSIAQIVVDQAASAIAQYGSPVSVVSRSTVYDESTGEAATSETTVSAKAVLETNPQKINSYTTLGISNATGVVYDIKAILASSYAVDIGDLLVVGGTRYTVEQVVPIWVQDQIATREIYGKRE